jgi:hypothetical protein
MKLIERGTAAAAILAALSSLACCLPISFLGALGLVGASAWAQSLRPYFLGFSALLLVVGFVQLYRKKSCEKRNTVSVVLFWLATVVVLVMILFPQAIASFLAG